MFSLLLLLFLPQEYYILDAVEIRLDNGLIIKTSAEVVEDRLFYSWNEDGYNVSLAKERVRSIRYLSLRVPGRQPHKKSKNATQRRISGRTVAYEVNGQVFLKCRHVDGMGRSVEGTALALNLVRNLAEVAHTAEGREMDVNLIKTTPGSNVSFKFFDLKGGLLCTGFLKIPGGRASKKGHGKGGEALSLTIPSEIDLSQVGLVEVISEKGDE